MKLRTLESGISDITGGIHEISLVGDYCPNSYHTVSMYLFDSLNAMPRQLFKLSNCNYRELFQ